MRLQENILPHCVSYLVSYHSVRLWDVGVCLLSKKKIHEGEFFENVVIRWCDLFTKIRTAMYALKSINGIHS